MPMALRIGHVFECEAERTYTHREGQTPAGLYMYLCVKNVRLGRALLLNASSG